MIELLAPAGNLDSFHAAIDHGADAVYLGVQTFNAREKADNFHTDQLAEITDYAHLFGVKVYITLNTLVKNGELDEFFKCVDSIYQANADALILQDLSLGKLIHEYYPDLALHASTQMGINNRFGAKICAESGFSRVVLSREATLEDLHSIKKETNLEIESFVHGALCVGFSGQCLMSSMAGGNSGNRGRCMQPCRKQYRLMKGEKELASGFLLSAKDICQINEVQTLTQNGVHSLKIEGRLRRPEYVAQAVDSYRKVIDGISTPQQEISNLKSAFNRGDYTKGYFFEKGFNTIYSKVQNHIGLSVGKVLSKLGKDQYFANFSKKPCVGNGYKILRDGLEIGGAQYLCEKNGKSVISSSSMLKVNDEIRLTNDVEQGQELLSKTRKLPLCVNLNLYAGEKGVLNLSSGDESVSVQSDFELSVAKNAPISLDTVKKCFNKLNETPFFLKEISIGTDNAFLTVSQLNQLRRDGIECLLSKMKDKHKRSEISIKQIKLPEIRQDRVLYNVKSAVILRENFPYLNEDALNAFDCFIYFPQVYDEKISKFVSFFKDKKPNAKCYLFLPQLFHESDFAHLIKHCDFDAFDGIYGDNLGAYAFARENGLEFFAGYGFYLFNRQNLNLLNDFKIENFVASPELNAKELEDPAFCNAFILTFGDLRIMHYAHCPLQNAKYGSCNDCQFNENIQLADEGLRKFTLKRFKTNRCGFYLYNCARLDLRKHISSNRNRLFDLSTFTKEETASFSPEGEMNSQSTKGHYLRGVQ